MGALLLLAFIALAIPTRAARPLLDHHQWDAYFALFARDTNVPWKTTSVRLDTYSGAPVDFAAYNVDPAETLLAGANRSARPIDTSRRKAVVRWRFSPPPGYRFETSDVTVPLGQQEGFYVVEARRGDAVQQVWLNRTHVGLMTRASPEGLVVWGVDLRTGRAIRGMNVAFLVGLQLITKRTDRQGLIVWRERARPTFALAEHGAGRAFVSILPQAPLPNSVVAVRLQSAVARAGETITFVGFARKRFAGTNRTASGEARVALVGNGLTLATTVAHVDAAGAFNGELSVPPKMDAGQYAVLAFVAGGVGGTSVHLDAASDLALAIRPACPCDPDRDVPLSVIATRQDAPVADAALRVQIVRTPHVVPPGTSDDAGRWGTTVVYDRTLRTAADGRAHVVIASPSDGLDSTYGIVATTRGATATSRIVVPSADVSLALQPVAARVDVGQPVAFDVRGFSSADGAPAADLPVTVRLTHGASEQQQSVSLDAQGRARVVFRQGSLGSNLAIAEAKSAGRRVLDAAAVLFEPSALSGKTASAAREVGIATDQTRYHPGQRIAVSATAPGAIGDALVTLDGARTYAARLVNVGGGNARTSLNLGDIAGAAAISAAFVRDGAIALGTHPLHVDAPGHPRATELVVDRPSYALGETLHATLHDGALATGATIAERIADGPESGSALFDDAPDVLSSGATSVQVPASDDPQWHAYVAPAHSRASDIFAAERPRKAVTEPPSIGAAAPRTMLWRVERNASGTLDLPVPAERGHFVLSILKMSDDGDVGAASVGFTVQ